MEHFLSALPSDERDFLRKFLHTLQSNRGLKACHDKLVRLLVERPYPVLQVLLHQSRDKPQFFIGKVLVTALQQLLNEEDEGFRPQFINFLANFPVNILEAASLRTRLTQRLGTSPLNERAFSALLSKPETKLLDEVVTYLQQQQWQSCNGGIDSKEFVLYQALNEKLHFVPLVSAQLKDFSRTDNISDAPLRNNLLILKVANEFSNTSQTLEEIGNIAKWLEGFAVSDIPQDLQEAHELFYADFQRLCTVIGFLKKYPESYKVIKVNTLLNATGMLELLFEYGISVSFEEASRLIESTYKWQQQMPAAKCVRDLELETLTYYAALSNVHDMILADPSLSIELFYTSKVQQLNMMLRRMRNLDVLCSLIEDIFQLVFLRWEHLHSHTSRRFSEMQTNRGKPNRFSSSNSTDDDAAAETPDTSLLPSIPASGVRHGFICRGRALQCLFSFLKIFVTKKLHSEDYKHASERIQMRFQRIVDIIGEALWKYSVLEKIDDSLVLAGTHHHYVLEAEEMLQLVQMHADLMEKSSSDDESRDRCNYTSLTRRKAAKKRRRATISGALASLSGQLTPLEQCRERANIMAGSVSAVQGVTDPVAQIKARKMIVRFSDRSIIPKMLGSPENLAIMALALKNFNDVKYIIETFNLQNTNLNHELFFVEQQQQVKLKLASIYTNYQQQEQNSTRHSKEPRATVDQIKNVAAKGFELSKIISVIDNFAQSQKVLQTPELKELLLKHSTNVHYSFLSQFEESNMNAVIVTDLIWNMPFNREISSNILMVIKRQQQISSGLGTNFTEDASVKASLPKEIGAMILLENLCECMRLVGKKTLCDLLSDNYYSLKPRPLAAELQRERAFQLVFYKTPSEVGRCEDMKAYMPLFQNLQSKCNYYARFSAYVLHLAKLLQLRDPNLEYHTSELLKIDPCDLIGELIFDCNMTPLEIESNVTALNLNLVHVIALNICPEIADKSRSSARPASMQKQETILNYIANQNHLLAYLLYGINKSSNPVLDKKINSVVVQRFLQLPEIQKLASLYNGNNFVSALRSDILNLQLVAELGSKFEQFNIIMLQMGNREPKHIQAKVIDKLIIELIREDTKNIYLAAYMHDIALKAKLIQENFTKIATTRLAKELIESTLQHKEATYRIPQDLRIQLDATLVDITIYAKVSEVLQFETWPQAYDFGLKTPNAIFEKLLRLHLYNLCYKWCKVVKLVERFAQYKRSFLAVLLDALLELSDNTTQGVEVNTYLLQILETFPTEDCVSFLDTHKDKFRSVVLLQYVIDFLAKNARNAENYKNYKMSLVIFEHLNMGERDQFWKLLKFPLLIIEELIMNAKFEILSKVLTSVRKSLQYDASKVHETAPMCSFCFDKRGHIYDIHTKSSSSPHKVKFQLGSDSVSSANSAFILLNFNLYQKDHIITNECIDLLLRIYATKALDYHISDTCSSSGRFSQTTDMQQSLDSLCGAFQLPKLAPSRDEWVRDDEATHCMCCRRAAFTMLMRRHHCRRCGRVVCFACSTHRLKIPELYEDVEVRICNDCHRNTEEAQRKSMRDSSAEVDSNAIRSGGKRSREIDVFKWNLSGNITHDKLLREEFCYEHAPSVALCLSILGYHLGKQKCVDLLLYHCRKLEKLVVPNPEVDYELVAKMMNCLALAAKVRGGPPEIETIREHSEIIRSVVQSGCEALIPPGPMDDNHNLRKLADSLVQAEKWQLALEVHLKCGFPTAGVMASYGISCLRAGCFDTAREKFSHCMPKLSHELANTKIYQCIMRFQGNTADINDNPSDPSRDNDIPHIKRSQRGPPILQEILKIIESIPPAKPQPETLHRASIIRNSNTSLASLLSRRKDRYAIPMQEPALNVLTTLANLKRIAKGHYSEGGTVDRFSRNKLRQTGFEECMHYLLTYGSHADILQFLMRHQELCAALKYIIIQNLESDIFIHNVFLVSLRCGQVPALIAQLRESDASLAVWRNTLLQTCRYLETKNLLNSLYQLQVLLNDPVRASMTCVKFYSMNCENFQQLHANAQHLQNAHRHLQSELETAQWQNISLEPVRKRKTSSDSRRPSTVSAAVTPSVGTSFPMQMDARSLNSHINTILKQLDVAKFLDKCERENGAEDGLITEKILKQMRIEWGKLWLPTLFNSAQDKIQVCILILLCGRNIEEGFGLAYRIIQDYTLSPMKVFAATAKYLARSQRLQEVEKLLNCIITNNGTNTRDTDEILSIAINSAINSHEPEVKKTLDNLAKKINSVELRISCHIFIGQLKSAYLLANKYERLADIRKILRQAELSNQIHIKKLCEKKLTMNVAQPEQL